MVNGICSSVTGGVSLSISVFLNRAIPDPEVFTQPKLVPMFLPRLGSVGSFQFTWLLVPILQCLPTHSLEASRNLELIS